MPRYLIVIGSHELEIDGPTLDSAIGTALREYPGEKVSGFAILAAEPVATDQLPDDEDDDEDDEE